MRWGRIAFIISIGFVVACGGSKSRGLQPTSLDFGEVYVRDSRTIDLTLFTLNGEPLKNAEFELIPTEFSSPFDLLEGGALGSSWALVFRPTGESEQTQGLVVKAGGERFDVQVSGRGKYAPQCPKTDPCHQVTFSFKDEQCVVGNAPDGTPCDRSDCATDRVCAAGVCTSVARANAPPICGQAVPSVTLQPAWTYEADPNREVSFAGLVDADDNLYLYDCARGDAYPKRCDIVSLTAEGQRRWRIPESALPASIITPDLSIVGGNLFVSGRSSGSRVGRAFRLTDGSLVWERSDIQSLLPAGAGRAAALLENKDAALNATVLVLDTETGTELARLTDVIPGWTDGMTVCDGAGTLYTKSALATEDPNSFLCRTSAVNVEQGLVWGAASGCSSPRATDGAHVFKEGEDVLNAVDGQPLYSDMGFQDEICFNSTQQALFTTLPGKAVDWLCRGMVVRRLRMSDGAEQSVCHVRENDVPLSIVSLLIPTREGGTVFLTASPSILKDATEKVSLRRTDADGNATFRAQLDGLVYHPPALTRVAPAAIVKGRWVMSGQRPSGASAIIAYDVPGLALAEHGWMTPGGSQARNNAPW